MNIGTARITCSHPCNCTGACFETPRKITKEEEYMKNNQRPMHVNRNRTCLGDYIMKTEHNGAGRLPQGLTPISDKNRAYMALKAAIIYDNHDTDNFIDALDQFIHATINEIQVSCLGQGIPELGNNSLGPRVTRNPTDNSAEIRLLSTSEWDSFILRLGTNDYHVLLMDGKFLVNGLMSDTVTFDEKVAHENN